MGFTTNHFHSIKSFPMHIDFTLQILLERYAYSEIGGTFILI